MLNRPNPFILVSGGGALFTCAGLAGGSSLPMGARIAATVALLALGLACIASGIWTYVRDKKKPEVTKPRARRAKDVTLGPTVNERADTSARRASRGDRSPRGGS